MSLTSDATEGHIDVLARHQPQNLQEKTALSFSGLSMVFPDGTRALDNIDLSLKAGEFVALVGPSGCGKSTLLKIASGLIQQSEGTCEINRESLGYVFQHPTLLPWRTVQKNVELAAELHGLDKQDRQTRARQAIELVGLAGSENKYPKQLSGGMQMRVSVARSLVLEPSVFLFDEPFGALDEITRERLNEELLALFYAKKFAGVFVTHSIAEAVYLATRVVTMSARPGQIISDIAVPFEYPRKPSLRYESRFAQLCGEVSHSLKAAHQ